MHDPMVVAFDVKAPIPRRARWRERADHPRWGLRRRRRTNPENLGEPVYPWWRPRGYKAFVAGRSYAWRTFVTVWHVEPDGRDSGEVCPHSRKWRDEDGKWHSKPTNRWRLHVHHWKLQVHPWQRFRHRFARCDECHRRMNRAVRIGTGWNAPGVMHRECHNLRSLRHERLNDEYLLRALFAAYRTAADMDEDDALERLRQMPDEDGRPHSSFQSRYRLERLLGWERDDDYRLVRATVEDTP